MFAPGMWSDGLDALGASALSEDHQSGLDSILAQRIEIIRGPATLLYGSGAAGGIVNVVDNRIAEQPLESARDDGWCALNGNSGARRRGRSRPHRFRRRALDVAGRAGPAGEAGERRDSRLRRVGRAACARRRRARRARGA
ncbi:MAG: TonB-dependent receptor plug domain-containing protein [Woeseiaceae bacterium]|nr:TonB-dependent receptor plug domain-containing protein [Woeseiaceae bacterium]